MKVRLYRGPYNGKVMNVPNGQTTIALSRADRRSLANFYESMSPQATVEFKNETYSIRMMGVNLNGHYYTAPAMHPDGSVYFEWDKPRSVRRGS